MSETTAESGRPNKSRITERRISRRDFLKLSALGTGAFFASNSLLGEFVFGKDPKLKSPERTLSEYQIGWQARPWVWINLAIASKRIDGVEIKPGEEVSLNRLLGFDEMAMLSRENTDPRIGYVAAQMSDPSKLDGWGYGLCLGSTTIFRACASNSPLLITERGTHYDIYPEYFEDMPIGTDAAIYKPDPEDVLPETDLKLKNPTNETLRLYFAVYDSNGNKLEPPEEQVSQVWYKATYLDHLVRILRRKLKVLGAELPKQYIPEQTLGNQKIVVRAAVAGDYTDYKVKISPVRHDASTINPRYGTQDYVFTRTLTLREGEGEKTFIENYISNYGQSPLED